MRGVPRPRARIDPAALTRAFAPDGLHGATGEGIARSAGVAKPTVYAHGGSKESIFLACVEAEVERLSSLLADADLRTRELGARARLGALAAAIIGHGEDHPAAARLLHLTARHATSAVAGEVDAALARLPARLAAILRADTTPACAERTATALLGAAAALALAPSPGGHEAGGAMLAEAFAHVLEPLRDGGGEERVQSVGLY